MRAGLDPIRIADDVFELVVETAADAQALASELRDAALAEDVVAGLDRVAVKFSPTQVEQVEAWLSKSTVPESKSVRVTDPIEIGIHYGGDGGPDFDQVCHSLGLSPEAFIKAHTTPVHTVEMIGFTPGFSYISGLQDGFEISRLSDPRPRVAAGSVGISAAYTGIYALNGPGGWPLIGHTEAELFRADRSAPFLLAPGQRVRFRAL